MAAEKLKAALALEPRLATTGQEAVVAQSLSLLGAVFATKDEPTVAEGLQRTATDRLAAALRDPNAIVGGSTGGDAGGVRRAAEAALLAPSLESFALLVGAMEWNGQPRSTEAAQLRKEAEKLRASYPQLHGARLGASHAAYAYADLGSPATMSLVAPHAQWCGLEPWYAASLQPNWLAACAKR